MKNARLITLVSFFSVVAIICLSVVWQRSPMDPELSQLRLQLAIEKIELQRRHLERNDALVFYGAASLVGSLCLGLVIVASGLHRAKVKQASVHVYRIGRSRIVVHERDLSLALRTSSELTAAEQLKQINSGVEKAIDIYCRVAETHHKGIQAFTTHSRALAALPPHQNQQPVSAPACPTCWELLQSGEIAPEKPLLFGFTPNGQKRGDWKDIFSTAAGGQSGFGKTNTLCLVIGQSVLHGVYFWLIDYHWPHKESLIAKIGDLRECPYVTYAKNLTECQTILDQVDTTIDRRLRNQEPITPIKVLGIDEVLRVVQHCPKTEKTIEKIGTEGRKVNVFGMFSAQSWKADKIDTTARDNLTSIFAHYMRPNQARALLQDSDEVKRVKHLRRGQMLFWPVNGLSEVVDVPFCTLNDMNYIATLVNKRVNVATANQIVDHPLDQVLDHPGQPTGLVKDDALDLVDQVNATLQNEGDFTKMIQLTKLSPAYVSRILKRKQTMSENARQGLESWLNNYQAEIGGHSSSFGPSPLTT